MDNKRTSIRLSSKDAEYFQAFYTENSRRLVYYVRKMGVPEDEVMDAVQDVLERLMKSIPALRKFETEPRKQMSFVYNVVRSVCTDKHRACARHRCDTYSPEELDEIAGKQLFQKEVCPEDIASDMELVRGAMSDKEWKIVSGKYMIGYSNEELATMHGYSKDSIHTIVSRTLKMVRISLRKEGGESNGSKK